MGKSAGEKKEYLPLPGAPSGLRLSVLGAAVSAFAAVPGIESIFIAVPNCPEKGEAAAREALPPHLLAENARVKIHFVCGGKTRSASVYNALAQIGKLKAGVPDYVLIHDGARPWISPALIQNILNAVKIHRAVIPLLPFTETPKEVDSPLVGGEAVLVKQHLKRALAGVAQTPQAFAFSDILHAHDKAKRLEKQTGVEFTDDAEVWSALCGPVYAIAGDPRNRKITFAEDLC